MTSPPGYATDTTYFDLKNFPVFHTLLVPLAQYLG
jgi:hypothetical protein